MFLESGFVVETGSGVLEFGRGAIAGAVVVGAAFLAGLSALRGGAAAVSALVVLLGAGALTAMSLGIIPALAPTLMDIFTSVFAAAVLVFLAATIRTARVNPVLGGVMFVSALGLVGLAIASAAMQGELAALLRFGLMGVAGFGAILALVEAGRGDRAAALILPGVAAAGVALLFPAFLVEASGFALAPQATFMAGVIAASLTALAEARTAAPTSIAAAAIADVAGPSHPSGAAFEAKLDAAKTEAKPEVTATSRADALRVSENQLAEVLDYAGLAVWDWTPGRSHHTESFAAIIGANAGEIISPQALTAMVSRRDRARYESGVLGGGDGPFDQTLHLQNGVDVRLRGARAVDRDGRIERLIAFVETTKSSPSRSAESGREQKLLEHKKSEVVALRSTEVSAAQPDAALTRAAASLGETAAAVGSSARHSASSDVLTESQANATSVPAGDAGDTSARKTENAASGTEPFSKPAALLETKGVNETADAGADEPAVLEKADKVLETVGAPATGARNLRDERPSSRLFRQRPFGRGLR